MPFGNLSDLENFSVGPPTILSGSGNTPIYSDSFNSRFYTPNQGQDVFSTQTTKKGVDTPIGGGVTDTINKADQSLGNLFKSWGLPNYDHTTGALSGGAATDSLFNFFNQYVGRVAIIIVGLVFLAGGFHMFAPNIVKVPHP